MIDSPTSFIARGVDDDVKPFDLHISTSGFANSLRSPENASRSQRVFMKIAKSEF
jgi:hypothetical protein